MNEVTKKDIPPTDRLQHIFNDVLEDLQATIKRTWAYQDLEERLSLQEALDAKISTYQELFGTALDTVREPEVTGEAACEYCQGHGNTPSPMASYNIPCIACDGSGRVDL